MTMQQQQQKSPLWSSRRDISRSRSNSRDPERWNRRSRSPEFRRRGAGDQRWQRGMQVEPQEHRNYDEPRRERDRDRDRSEHHSGRHDERHDDHDRHFRDRDRSYRRQRDRIVVKDLLNDVDEGTVRYTFAPHAAVDFVDMAPDTSRPGFQMAFVRFSSGRGASDTMDAILAMDPPLRIGDALVRVEWADDSEFHKHIVTGRKGRRDVQEQLDWVTANARAHPRPDKYRRHQPQQQSAMSDFVFQPNTGYFFSAERRMYYDPNSQLYYSTDNGCYLQYDAATNGYTKIDAAATGDTSSAAVSGQECLQQQLQQQQMQKHQQLHMAEAARKAQKEAEAAVEQALSEAPVVISEPVLRETKSSVAERPLQPSSAGSVKFSLSTGKRLNKDMQRWKEKHEQLESEVKSVKSKAVATKSARQADDGPKFLSGVNAVSFQASPNVPVVAERKPVASPEAPAAAAAAAPSMPSGASAPASLSKTEATTKHGVRPRTYVSVEKKVCLLCQRQFKDEAKLEKHELHSELHKTSLKLDEYAKVKRIEASAKALGIDLGVKRPKRNRKPKKRPFVSLHDEAAAAAKPLPPKDEPIGDTNVGNKLLQAMGWKKGQGLGKHGTGITAPVTAQVHAEGAGLGSQSLGALSVEAGDDRKTIAYKMARSRFEQSPAVVTPPAPRPTSSSSAMSAASAEAALSPTDIPATAR